MIFIPLPFSLGLKEAILISVISIAIYLWRSGDLKLENLFER